MAFSAKTLLVVGAGASSELGFPTGAQIKDQIRACTDIKWNGLEFSGDREFCTLAADLARNHHGGQVQPILDACAHIHDNLPLSGSIDQFLSSHQADEVVVRCAKLAIALQIAKAERACHLNGNATQLKHTDFIYLKDTYLPRLWFRLQNGEPISDWPKFFENLKIITFNYDRVIEQFFVLALVRFCRLTLAEAIEFVGKLPIVHVYGSLGTLSSSDGCCMFAPSEHDILKTSERILTFSETIADDIKKEIAEYVDWSQLVVFLGFSYAGVNLSLLPKREQPNHAVVGTACRMSTANRTYAQSKLNQRLDPLRSRATLTDCTCAQLFDDYELTLS